MMDIACPGQVPHLFGDDSVTVQAFMWQENAIEVARYAQCLYCCVG